MSPEEQVENIDTPEVEAWKPSATDTVDTSQPFSFGEEEELEAFSFGEMEELPFQAMYTQHAAKEQAVMASGKTGQPVQIIQDQIKSGDFSMVSEASDAFGEEFYGQMFSLYEKNIEEANTPKEVAVLLKDLEQQLQRKPTLAEQRAAYVNSVTRGNKSGEEADIESLHPILRETVKNNLMANNVGKMQMEYDNSVSYMDMAIDFLEITTLVGAGSEEVLKHTADIYDNLDKLEKLPFDKQMALIETMVESAKNQETYLFNNNNSIIVSGQIDTFYNAILEGARMRAEGYTEAEVGSMLETAFNGTLFVGQAYGLAKSVGKMGKFLMRRIHSSKNLAAAAKEQEELMQAVLRDEALRRMSPDNAQYRMEGTVPEKVEDLAVTSIQSPSINPTGLRPNLGLFDTLYKFVPSELNSVRASKGLKGVVEETGLTKEEVAERVMPTPTPETEQGMMYVNEQRMLNDLIFVDQRVLPEVKDGKVVSKHSVGQALGRELERPMGTSLTPDYSATGFKPNNTKGSLGTFTFLLGDGAMGGFKTAEEAQEAMEKAAVGYKYQVVKKDNGYFVETELEHYFNPYSDVAGLEIQGTTPSWAVSWALNHYRRVEEDLLRGLAAMKNVNRSTIQKIEDKAKGAVRPLSAEQNKLLMDILERGDSLEEDWVDLGKLNDDLGLQVPDKVFEAYRTIRGIYDDIYAIREKNYYNKLRTANQKYIDFEDGGDMGIGRAVKHDELDSDVIYDSISKRVINKDGLKGDEIIVKLGTPKKVGDEYFSYSVVQPKQIKPLEAGRTLNKRKGHIDRMYRDAGWVVEAPVKGMRVVDGKEVVIKKVTHIVKTQAEAEEIAAKTEGAKAKASRETQALEGDIYNDGESVQFGYGASHLKARGEKVKGSDGIEGADTLNAFESLFKGIGNLSSALDYNAYQAMRIKFNKGFAEYLKEGAVTDFLPKWEDMVSEEGMEKLTSNSKMKTELINHHAYLASLRQHNRGKLFQDIDKALRPILAPFKFDPSTQKAATDLQRLTSELYIVWNGLYQGVQNLVPALYNIGTGGKSGIEAVAMLPAVMLAFKTGNTAPLARLVGDEKLTLELIEELRTNGLIDAVGRSNDFLDLARTEGASVPLSKTKGTLRGVKQLYKQPRKLSLGIQESAIVLNNALAYLTEFNELRRAGGAFDGKGKADISFQAQKRTQSQNSLDRFAYQDQASPVAMAAQFMQAVHKFLLDAVVEPQWEVLRKPINALMKPVTDKHLGSLGKNKGRYADSWNKAFVTTMITYGFFGLEGGMGKGMGMALEDYIRNQYEPDEMPSVLDAFLDGGMNAAINASLEEGSVDVNATMSPSAFIDMVTSLVFEDFPQVNMFGASAFALGGLVESVFSAGVSIKSSWDSEDIHWDDAANAVFLEGLENLKLMDTAVKSYVVYWTGRNASARSWSSELPIMKAEAVAKNVGIQSEMAADYYYRKDFGDVSLSLWDTVANKITDTMLQNYARDATSAATKHAMLEGGDVKLGWEEQIAIRSRWIAAAKQMTDPKYHPNIERAFENRGLKFGSAGYEIYTEPYLKKAAAGNKTEYLKLIEQRAPEGEGRETIKHIREGQAILEGK